MSQSKKNSATTALAETHEASLQLEVDRNELLEELQPLQALAGTDKSTIPITRNIFIDASETGIVTLIASNLETALETQIKPTGLIAGGKTTASASDLLKIVKSAPPGNIHFSVEKEMMKVQFNGTEFELPTLPANQYPALPKLGRSARKMEIPTELLKNAIAQVIFAVTDEELRYAMNGALLRIDGNRIVLVGTDGHRLSYISPQHLEKISNEVLEVLVPRIALEQLQKLLFKSKEDTVTLAVEKSYGLIAVESKTLLFRLIEAQFPNFEKFVSIRNTNIATFDTERLRTCLDKVTALAEPRLRSTSFRIAQNIATITWSGNDGSRAQSTVEAEQEGNDISISFNGSYILEFLRAVKSKQVRLEVNNESTAAVLKPADDDGNDHKYVVMPIRM